MVIDLMEDSEQDSLQTQPTLLSSVRRREEDAWTRFHEMYRNFIHGAARAAGLSREESDDIVQETMITVQNHIDGFSVDPDRGKFRTWLRTIVRSRISDQYRRKKRNPLEHRVEEASDDESQTSFTNRIPDPDAEELDRVIDEKLEQAILLEARQNAKAAARIEDYQTYDLFAVQELSAQEAADTLLISPATVRVRTYRVRQIIDREMRRIVRELDQPDGN